MIKQLSLALFISSSGFGAAIAEEWPTGPVRIVVPFAAGGATDVVARSVAERLTQEFGQPFIVENRGGAGGSIGSEYVARSSNDGHTLLLGTSSTLAIAPHVYENLQYEPLSDFESVSLLGAADVIIAIRGNSQIASLDELIEYARTNPGELNFASSGVGSISHLLGEYFNYLEDTDIIHIPYVGDGQMLPSIVGGEVDLTFNTSTAFLPYIQSGDIRALALISDLESSAFSDLPKTGEVLNEKYAVSQFFGFVAPSQTSSDIIDILASKLDEILSEEEIVQAFQSIGFHPVGGTPEEFRDYIIQEDVKWREIVTATGVSIK